MLSDGTWTYTWEHGRQLASMTDGTTTWNYNYNSNGLRASRSNGTTTYSYVYNGSQLTQMTATVGDTVETLYFTYDASGIPMTVTYNDVVYYYVTNIQGDVIAILDSTGTTVVEYTYDAWGNLLSSGGTASTLATHNPLRYRGYVYDTETGLYYLQTRYYNPEIGRFINADAYTATGQGLVGNNTFAYCNNCPVNRVDSGGQIPVCILLPITCGIIENSINAIYYEFSDGESDLTPSSYTENEITRWEKLDYTKQQTGEEHYNLNAWRYYNEYSVHEMGWQATEWAYEEDVWLASWIADRCATADVLPDKWDDRWYVNALTIFYGLTGGPSIARCERKNAVSDVARSRLLANSLRIPGN